MILYAATIFLSAFLLFQVQPLIAKIILPWFGGTAAVWTICMLFFQVLLLAGYVYSHAYVRFGLPARRFIHIALLAVAAATLPLAASAAWKPEGGGDPTWRILGLLATSVGLPYFVLSTTGPLVQAWYARAHPGAAPYRLFALSNLGSMLALVSYPLAVEPLLALGRQTAIWSAGFVLFALPCASLAWRGRDSEAQLASHEQSDKPGPGLQALWAALAACASVLLLAFTGHMTLNSAAIPFLWVLPLALYFRSFGLVPAVAVSASARRGPRRGVRDADPVQSEHLDPDPALLGDALRGVHGVSRGACALQARSALPHRFLSDARLGRRSGRRAGGPRRAVGFRRLVRAADRHVRAVPARGSGALAGPLEPAPRALGVGRAARFPRPHRRARRRSRADLRGKLRRFTRHRTQFLRRSQRARYRRRAGSHAGALPRHHHPRQAVSGSRPARLADELLRKGIGHRARPPRLGRARTLARGRSRTGRGDARRLRQIGRCVPLLRYQPQGGRARPLRVQLPRGQPGAGGSRARRRAPVARARARSEFRRPRARCLFERRHPGAPAHGGSVRHLPAPSQARRHSRRAHLQPLPRPGAGGAAGGAGAFARAAPGGKRRRR